MLDSNFEYMDIAINYVGVLVGAIAAFAVGAIWYSLLFRKQWMRLMGITPEGMKGMRLTGPQAMGIGFFTVLLMVYVLAHFEFLVGVADMREALVLGFWIWLGFQAPLLANSVLYENRPFSLYLINASQQLVATLVASAVLFYMM